MKKLKVMLLAGVMAISIGTPVFAASKNKGSLYGWENSQHKPDLT